MNKNDNNCRCETCERSYRHHLSCHKHDKKKHQSLVAVLSKVIYSSGHFKIHKQKSRRKRTEIFCMISNKDFKHKWFLLSHGKQKHAEKFKYKCSKLILSMAGRISMLLMRYRCGILLSQKS